jgi:hypothetical protein
MDKEDDIAEKERFVKVAQLLCEDDNKMSAMIVASGKFGMYMVPLRISREEAFALLVAACTVVEPDDMKDKKGGLH